MAGPMDVARLAALLHETTAADASRIAAAERELSAAADHAGYSGALLQCIGAANSPDAHAAAVAIPAAAALHNFVRNRWPNRLPSQQERESTRMAILQALVVAPQGPIVKLLAESFRIIVTEDVTRAKCWPDLLPALCQAMQESNLMVGKEQSPVKTANALVAVHTLLKPYKYFQNPGSEKEAAPPELEAIVKALLEPLLGMLGILATGTLTAAAAENGDPTAAAAQHNAANQPGNDALLHTLLKCFHHTVAAYMPAAMVPSLQRWLEVLTKILEQAPTFRFEDERVHAPRGKAVKRVIQAMQSLVTRHRRHVDKFLPAVCTHAAALASALASRRLSSGADSPTPAVQSRQCALCFDLLARVSETAPGYKLLAPNFGRLLESAVYPALCAGAEDEADWEEDEEEYLRRNLPADSDDPTGFNEELYAPRQSAANLLGLLAERGSAGGSAGGGGNDGGKRKKGGGGAARAKGKKGVSSTPGDAALRYFERFRPPGAPGAPNDRAAQSSYFGVLVAYGALSKWMANHGGKASTSTLARQRVLPVLAPGAVDSSTIAGCAVRAAACWALGELSNTGALPEEPTHAALLATLVDPVGKTQPALRSASASAIATSLHASCWPKNWEPLLTAAAAAVNDAAGEEEENASSLRALRLITVAAEVAPEHCGAANLANPLAAALARAASSRTPAPPATLPPVVETALEALVAVAQAAEETAEEDEEENDMDDDGAAGGGPPHPSLTSLVPHLCAALRRAWLPTAWGFDAWNRGGQTDMEGEPTGAPVACCMGDCSRLLSRALRWCPDAASGDQVQLAQLVAAHASLLPEWDAWEEEEEEAALEVLDDVSASFKRGALVVRDVNAMRPLFESYGQFIGTAIDQAPALGCARACRRSHALMALAANVGGDASAGVARKILGAATDRLRGLVSPDLPVARPLVLAASAALARGVGPAPGSLSPNVASDWAGAAARTLVTSKDDLSASELIVLASSSLRALGAAGAGAAEAITDASARASAMESALRAVLGLRDLRASGGELGAGRRNAEEEDANDSDDDSDDDDDDGSDDSDEEDFERDSDVDSDSDGTAAGSSPPDEETEAQFLARYAAEARRLAGAGDVDPDSGDVEDADDGSELELDGVMMGPPGSEARALLNWLQSRATAADLGALAATLQAHPVDGLEQVSNLQTVLSSIPQAAGGGAGGGNGSGGPSASSGSAGVSMDFGGLAL